VVARQFPTLKAASSSLASPIFTLLGNLEPWVDARLCPIPTIINLDVLQVETLQTKGALPQFSLIAPPNLRIGQPLDSHRAPAPSIRSTM
jgi:hypothetical protein